MEMQITSIENCISVPFSQEQQLLQAHETVPGHPCVRIDDRDAVKKLIREELATTRLSRLYYMLFLASNRENISPLHHQAIKGRTICITERPDLHLIWYYGRLFIKPMPALLFSYDMWNTVIRPVQDEDGFDLILEALGFLRTYSRLIRHESDFRIAREHHLLPPCITWEAWCHFISNFSLLADRRVARRYHYGEIRLTRLNFWHTLLYGRSYMQVHHSYATFFARFGAPYLLFFGATTVLMAALQTGIEASIEGGRYHGMAATFVPFCLILTILGLAFPVLLFMFFWARELVIFIFCYRPLA